MSYCNIDAAGTPAFMAPEICTNDPSVEINYLPAIDVFAMGATLYCMACGRPPWMGANVFDLAAKIKTLELTFPDDDIDPHLKVNNLLLDSHFKYYIHTNCHSDHINCI